MNFDEVVHQGFQPKKVASQAEKSGEYLIKETVYTLQRDAPEDCLLLAGRCMALDLLHDICYHVEHEAETSLSVQMVPNW
jgi:hypothetical protein